MFHQSGTEVRDLGVRVRNGILDQNIWRWTKEGWRKKGDHSNDIAVSYSIV